MLQKILLYTKKRFLNQINIPHQHHLPVLKLRLETRLMYFQIMYWICMTPMVIIKFLHQNGPIGVREKVSRQCKIVMLMGTDTVLKVS